MDGNPYGKWRISKSKIHGDGVFTARNIHPHEKIAVGIQYILRVYPKVTQDFGSLVNHSYTPSAYLRYSPSENTWNVYALIDLPVGTEVTINYNHTPHFIEKAKEWYT